MKYSKQFFLLLCAVAFSYTSFAKSHQFIRKSKEKARLVLCDYEHWKNINEPEHPCHAELKNLKHGDMIDNDGLSAFFMGRGENLCFVIEKNGKKSVQGSSLREEYAFISREITSQIENPIQFYHYTHDYISGIHMDSKIHKIDLTSIKDLIHFDVYIDCYLWLGINSDFKEFRFHHDQKLELLDHSDDQCN